MDITSAQARALRCLVRQKFASLANPGAFSPDLSGVSSVASISTLRALYRRNLVAPASRSWESYVITPEGMLYVRDFVSEFLTEERQREQRLRDVAVENGWGGVLSTANRYDFAIKHMSEIIS